MRESGLRAVSDNRGKTEICDGDERQQEIRVKRPVLAATRLLYYPEKGLLTQMLCSIKISLVSDLRGSQETDD
jgi:hypothetical protein